LRLEYSAAPATQLNNGHTIEYEMDDAGGIVLGGERFELSQFHFHAPAEHEIGGARFDMELHLVHADSRGRIAVLGVLIRSGEEHPAFEELLAEVPAQDGEERELERVDPAALLPPGAVRYSYRGSLTTPPCSEGVRWTVLRDPIELSPRQIARFTAVIDGNNRPLQPLGGRELRLGRSEE
jgi:carbonic anhydrase